MMRRTFTVAQANALIPWLAEHFGETRKLAKELQALRLTAIDREQARALSGGGGAEPPLPREDMLARLSQIEDQIRKRVEDATALGIEVRRADGLVDFPAWIEGQLVYLCWRFGELKISFWHPVAQGFDGRRSLSSEHEAASELN